jgi:hypothetical protein
MPLAAFAGQNDDRMPVKRMEGWRRFAANPAQFSLDVFPGSHFFIKVWVCVCVCVRVYVCTCVRVYVCVCTCVCTWDGVVGFGWYVYVRPY